MTATPLVKPSVISDSMAVVDFSKTAAADIAFDTLGYSSFVLAINAQGTSSTVTLQTSSDADSAHWTTHCMTDVADTAGALVANTTAVKTYYGPIRGRFLNVHIAGITGVNPTAGQVLLRR